jgi:hypothetical protein
MTITVGLASTLGILTTFPTQVVFAVPLIGSLGFEIQSNRDSTGYMVCDPICHVAASSDRDDNSSNDSEAQPR